MARIRTIKPEFFLNEDMAKLGPYARLFFIGILCHSDREGRLEDRPERLQVQILPYNQDKARAEDLLEELSPRFIERFEVKGGHYIQVVNFTKHQRPNIKEPPSVIPKADLSSTKKNMQARKKTCQVGADMLGKGKGKGNGSKEGKGMDIAADGGDGQSSPFHTFMDGVCRDYFNQKPGDQDQKEKDAVSASYRRYGRAARDILAFAKGDPSVARSGLQAIGARMNRNGLEWNLETVAKRFPEWMSDPEAYERETQRAR